MFECIYIKAIEKTPLPMAISPCAKPEKYTEEVANQISGLHLIVLVHGFQGCSNDLKSLKNNIAVFHPEALFLCSEINENKTEGNIEDMGEMLSQEVINYIQEWCPEPTLAMISFIGHSLGGVIIRAALPFLFNYKNKMCTFVTISSPHLGYMYASNTIVNAGLWILKRLKNSLCLEQLTLTDETDYKDCYLYKLSSKEGLNWFKNILLLSSYQDRYIPVESARIELSQKALEDEK